MLHEQDIEMENWAENPLSPMDVDTSVAAANPVQELEPLERAGIHTFWDQSVDSQVCMAG